MCERRAFRIRGEPEKGEFVYCSMTWGISYAKMCVCVCRMCVCMYMYMYVYMFLHASMMRLGSRLGPDGLDFHHLVMGNH